MKIILLGFSGKLGSLVYQELQEKHEFVALGDMTHEIVFDQVCLSADVVIDFSEHNYSYPLLQKFITHGISVISGTTNFSLSQMESLSKSAKKYAVSVFVVGNFDPNINSFLQAVKLVAQNFSQIEIIETHHRSKLDAPSGTAKMIAQILADKNVIITSKRSDNFIYRHEVICYSQYQVITLIHEVKDKRIYVEGVINALNELSSFVGVKTLL